MPRFTRNPTLWAYFFGGPAVAWLASDALVRLTRFLLLGEDAPLETHLVAFFVLFLVALGIGFLAVRLMEPFDTPLVGIAPLAPLFIGFLPEIRPLVIVLVAVAVALSASTPWLREKSATKGISP